MIINYPMEFAFGSSLRSWFFLDLAYTSFPIRNQYVYMSWARDRSSKAWRDPTSSNLSRMTPCYSLSCSFPTWSQILFSFYFGSLHCHALRGLIWPRIDHSGTPAYFLFCRAYLWWVCQERPPWTSGCGQMSSAAGCRESFSRSGSSFWSDHYWPRQFPCETVWAGALAFQCRWIQASAYSHHPYGRCWTAGIVRTCWRRYWLTRRAQCREWASTALISYLPSRRCINNYCVAYRL